MEKEILVTVIVPAYNHEKYVIECLESIHHQTYRGFQWIVVDDCSKDNTPHILKENQEKYGYQLILHENNMGISETLTQTIKDFAKGKYISCCASDDAWLPDKLQKQVDFMESHPEYAQCYGDCYEIDTESNVIGLCDNTNFRDGYIFEDILCIKFHPPVNYMTKKEVLEEMGYYPEGVIAEDFRMNCLIAKKYSIGYIREPLSYYRIEQLQKKRNPISLYDSHLETIKLFKEEPIFKKALQLHYYRCWVELSNFKISKIESLKYFIPSLIFFYQRNFLVGIYHFFFRWK